MHPSHPLSCQAATAAGLNPAYNSNLIPVSAGSYRVLLDGAVLGSFETPAAVGALVSNSLGVQLSEGSHTLTFEGTGVAGISRFGSNMQYAVLSNAHLVVLDNLTFGVVPEPGTWALMGLGLIGLVGLRQRR